MCYNIKKNFIKRNISIFQYQQTLTSKQTKITITPEKKFSSNSQKKRLLFEEKFPLFTNVY